MFDDEPSSKRTRCSIVGDYSGCCGITDDPVNGDPRLALFQAQSGLALASQRPLTDEEHYLVYRHFKIFNCGVSLTALGEVLTSDLMINIINLNTRVALKVFEVVFNQNLDKDNFLQVTFLDPRCQVLKSIELLTRLIQVVDLPMRFLDAFLRSAIERMKSPVKKSTNSPTQITDKNENPYSRYRSNFIEGIRPAVVTSQVRSPAEDEMETEVSVRVSKPRRNGKRRASPDSRSPSNFTVNKGPSLPLLDRKGQ